jgi:hypothetical protein
MLLAAGLCGPTAAAANPDAPAGVHVSRCKTGPRPKDRHATYKAWMRAVPGSVRMAMRFKLVVKQDGVDGQQPLSNSDLSVWHRSHYGVTRYVYSQTVKRLQPGSSYRVRVQFRWYDSSGQVIESAKRWSGACVQDAALPNLRVSSVLVTPGPSPGTAIYGVSVRNTGGGAAEAFSTALFVDGALADSRTVDHLDPGATTTVQLNGPTCRQLRAVVDREHAVAETVEDDNALRSSC